MKNEPLTGEKIITLLLVGLVAIFLCLAVLHMLESSVGGSLSVTSGDITSKSEGRFSVITWTKPIRYNYTFKAKGSHYISYCNVYDHSHNPLRKFAMGSKINVYYLSSIPSINTVTPGFFDVRYLGFLLLYAGITFLAVAFRIWKKLRI